MSTQKAFLMRCLFFSFLLMLVWSAAGAALPSGPVEIALHFNGGLTPQSHQAMPAKYKAEDRLPEILFLDRPHPFHVVLRNRTESPLFLWRPYCPEADRALTFEFKTALD